MMNIMLAGNSGVYDGIELVIYSTMTHNKDINWYVFTMDIELDIEGGRIGYYGLQLDQKRKLYDIVKYFDPNSNIIFINALDLYKQHLSGSVNEYCNFTPYAALRLIADLALPYVDDLLYLDCDTATMSNFEGMYQQCKNNPSEFCFAVYAEDACGGDGEMVSGVMFLNLAKIRQNGFLESARHNYNEILYTYPDQMALRDSGPIARLPNIYGYLWDYRKTGIHPVIVHFTNDFPCKIYSSEINKATFYRIYPDFAYVKEGCDMIDKILFTEGRNYFDSEN